MAARETGIGAVEQYMHAGKLLALDLLVQVLENPTHNWSTVRAEVWKAPCLCIMGCGCVYEASNRNQAEKSSWQLTWAVTFQSVIYPWMAICHDPHKKLWLLVCAMGFYRLWSVLPRTN